MAALLKRLSFWRSTTWFEPVAASRSVLLPVASSRLYIAITVASGSSSSVGACCGREGALLRTDRCEMEPNCVDDEVGRPPTAKAPISVGEWRISEMMSGWTSEDRVDDDMAGRLAPRADCSGLP